MCLAGILFHENSRLVECDPTTDWHWHYSPSTHGQATNKNKTFHNSVKSENRENATKCKNERARVATVGSPNIHCLIILFGLSMEKRRPIGLRVCVWCGQKIHAITMHRKLNRTVTETISPLLLKLNRNFIILNRLIRWLAPDTGHRLS